MAEFEQQRDVWGALLTPAGKPLSPPFAVARKTYALYAHDSFPALATSTEGNTLVVYPRMRPEPPLGASRISARIISQGAPELLISSGCELGGARGGGSGPWCVPGLLVLVAVLMRLARGSAWIALSSS